MSRRIYTIIILIILWQQAKSQDYLHFILREDSVGSGVATSSAIMTKEINKDAIEYARYAPIPRFAKMDYAFGSDLAEFKNMGGYGVIYIPSLNRDSSEYPISSVYFRINEKVVSLQKIGEIKVKVNDQQTIHTFGKNRVDYFYLIPYDLTQIQSELLIDWSKNRKDFVLAKFPDGNKLNFLKGAYTPDAKNINVKVLKEFLIREYNLKIE